MRPTAKGPPIGNDNGVSNGNVIDDATKRQKVLEAVRSTILATAWLLVNRASRYTAARREFSLVISHIHVPSRVSSRFAETRFAETRLAEIRV